ncbi:CrfX protein [Stutzerimonas tarimensis]|uniref:CrfX protein n=1 Tax=Stutzerimonas tarimensis TaxID=1507735 RepID=A0ABV7T4Y1_9GAMM
MRDPFEDSLREMLNEPSGHDDDACLERVLQTANRQVGAADLFALVGHWCEVFLILASGGPTQGRHVTRCHPSKRNQQG